MVKPPQKGLSSDPHPVADLSDVVIPAPADRVEPDPSGDAFSFLSHQLPDLAHDRADRRRGAIFGLTRNMGLVDTAYHADLLSLVEPALDHPEWQIEEIGIEALGAMLVYLQGDLHFAVSGRLLSIVKKNEDWRLVKQALHSLTCTRFDLMDLLDRYSAIDVVTKKIGYPQSTDVQDEARSLIKKNMFRLPFENHDQVWEQAKMMAASDDWSVRHSVALLIDEVFLAEAPFGIHPENVHDLLGASLFDPHWKVRQTSLHTVANYAPQLAENRHIIKKVADSCLSKKIQVAQAARKALKEIVLRASPAVQKYIIDFLEDSFVGNPAEKRLKIVATIARIFKIVQRSNQHDIVKAISGFYGDSDPDVSEIIRDSLKALIDLFHESQPWHAARLLLILKTSGQEGLRFVAENILEHISVESPLHSVLETQNHPDKAIKNVAKIFLKKSYAQVTDKNVDGVMKNLETLLTYKGRIFEPGLLAASETAPFLKTQRQQDKMTLLAQRVASTTGSGSLMEIHVLRRMPSLQKETDQGIRTSSLARIGRTIRNQVMRLGKGK